MEYKMYLGENITMFGRTLDGRRLKIVMTRSGKILYRNVFGKKGAVLSER